MTASVVPIRANGAATIKASGAAALVEPGAGDCCCCPSDACAFCAAPGNPLYWANTTAGVTSNLPDDVCIPLPGGRVFPYDGNTYDSVRVRIDVPAGDPFPEVNGTFDAGGVACVRGFDLAGAYTTAVLLSTGSACEIGGGESNVAENSTPLRYALVRESGRWVSVGYLLSSLTPAGAPYWFAFFYGTLPATDGDPCDVPLEFTNQLTGTLAPVTVDGVEFLDMGSGGTMVWTPCVPAPV